ncbi:class I SAM-dependent methyltransferase [Candidatus Omnitrophota bacterium]
MSKQQKKNIKMWEDLHKSLEKTGSHTKYPNEILVRWVSINSPKDGDKALDIGFGSGANLKFLEEKEYKPYGIEVSPTAIKTANKISGNFKLSLFTPPKINFPNNYFSFVVSLQCLYYNIDIEKVLEETYRIMKDGAYLYISFYGKNHWWIKECSKKVGPTHIEWSKNHPVPSQWGLRLRFFDTKQRYLKLFHEFSNVEVNKYTYDIFGRHHEYVYVVAQKITGKKCVLEHKNLKKRVKNFYAKQ